MSVVISLATFYFVHDQPNLNGAVRYQREERHDVERSVYFNLLLQITRRHLAKTKVEHHRILPGVVVGDQLADGGEP